MTRRLLITGSRDWDDREAIAEALTPYIASDPAAILVSGACPTGSDRMCEEFWQSAGGVVELHPADWNLHGKSAGFKRNAEMVALGANACVAFIRNGSRGASHTAALAEKAGIKTRRVTKND